MQSVLNNLKVIVAFSLIVVYSCNREKIILETLPHNPNPVVACFITANSNMLSLKLTQSTGVIGFPYGEIKNIKNADVSITNLIDTIVLQYDSFAEEYFSWVNDPFLFYNVKYYLTIKHQNALITSTCIIPEENNKSAILVNASHQKHANENGVFLHVDISLADNPEQINYYRLIPMAMVVDTLANIEDTSLYPFGQGIEECYISDAGKNGATIKTNFNHVFNSYDGQKVIGVRVAAINCSKEYFIYHQKINTIQFGSGFTDPIILPNNITNGMGVFAGYANIIESEYLFK